MILPVLNGMRHVDVLAARFGEKAVLGCVCKVATMVDEEGRIVQLAKFQELAYGEMKGVASARTEELDAFMQGAPNSTPSCHRQSSARCGKNGFFSRPWASVTCLMRGSIGEIMAAPGGEEFVLSFLKEVVSVVSAVGHPPTEGFLESTKLALTTKGSPLTSSMYRDLQGGREIEGDQIIGDLLVRAQSTQVAIPLLSLANTLLAVYRNRGPHLGRS